MAYEIVSQNNTTTTLSDGVNVIRVPARVVLATSTTYTITKINNNIATLEDGNGKVYKDIPCVAVLYGGGSGSDPHNLGWYADLAALQAAHATGEDGDFAILGSTDTVWVWDSGTSAWKDTDTKGQVESVNNMTGQVVLTGADLTTLVTVATATLTQELANDTIYDCGEMTSITLTLPATMDAKFIAQLNFTSGATPTSITAPNTVKWLGNDITGGVFVPVASKRYCVLFFYDGTAVRGLVQGA